MAQTTPSPAATDSAILGDIAKRLAGGARPDQIATSLTAQGFTQQDATLVVNRVNVQFRQAMAKISLRRAGIGALWCIGGSAVTYYTFASAANGGGYVIAWGAIIFGGYRMIAGLIGWLKYRD